VIPITVHPHWGRDLPGASLMVWEAPRRILTVASCLLAGAWIRPDGILSPAGKGTGLRASRVFPVVLGYLWVPTADGLVFRGARDGAWLRQEVRFMHCPFLRGAVRLLAGSGGISSGSSPRLEVLPVGAGQPRVVLRFAPFSIPGFAPSWAVMPGLFRVSRERGVGGAGDASSDLAKAHVRTSWRMRVSCPREPPGPGTPAPSQRQLTGMAPCLQLLPGPLERLDG
jgi:hypothetical protein